MKTLELIIEGKKAAGFEIDLPGPPLVLARGQRGFVMCGFLNIAAADKFGQAAAVVKGVSSVEELLAKTVTDVSQAALALGIQPGMTGREALEKLV